MATKHKTEFTDCDLTNLRTLLSFAEVSSQQWRETRETLYNKCGRMRDELGEHKTDVNAELLRIVSDFLQWGQNNASPIDANSPHDILCRAFALLERLKAGTS